MDSLRRPADMSHYEDLRVFVLEKAGQCAGADELTGKLELVLEELLVNVFSYAYPDGNGDVVVFAGVDEHNPAAANPMFCVRIVDYGAPFNPLQKDTPDLEMEVEDRPIGGLGIYLVKEMADKVEYSDADGKNTLSVCFSLPT